MNEAEYLMKTYRDAEADNTLGDQQNSSYDTKAESNQIVLLFVQNNS